MAQCSSLAGQPLSEPSLLQTVPADLHHLEVCRWRSVRAVRHHPLSPRPSSGDRKNQANRDSHDADGHSEYSHRTAPVQAVSACGPQRNLVTGSRDHPAALRQRRVRKLNGDRCEAASAGSACRLLLHQRACRDFAHDWYFGACRLARPRWDSLSSPCTVTAAAQFLLLPPVHKEIAFPLVQPLGQITDHRTSKFLSGRF